MAKERVRKEEIRMMLAEAKADTSTLSVSSAWAHRHLGDAQGKQQSEALGKNIQAALSHFLRYLDTLDDEHEIDEETERGLHNAKLETLIDKRDRMNERIEKIRGNNHAGLKS